MKKLDESKVRWNHTPKRGQACLHFSLDIDNYETPLMAFRNKRATDEIRRQNSK